MMFLPRKQQQEAPPRCLRESGGAGEEWQSILEKALVHGYEVCYVPQGIETHRRESKNIYFRQNLPYPLTLFLN